MQAPADTQSSQSQATTKAQLQKPLLQRGSQGSAVVELQKLLTHWRYYTGSPNGIFDKVVEDAVKAYQHRVFLAEDGIVGQLTWQALYTGTPVNMPVLQHGSCTQAVVTLQTVLQATGDFDATVNGHFGATTHAAVRAFQKRHGLVVDGIVGAYTWHTLSKVPH